MFYTQNPDMQTPLAAAVSDNYVAGTQLTWGTWVSASFDFLGRVTGYTDVRGKTTSYGYDLAGRVTSETTPAGTLTTSYDPNSGEPTTTALNGTTLSTASYDSTTGRLSSVSYSNGTAATVGYDALGNESSLKFTSTSGGALLAGNQLTRSPGGRIVSELQDITGSSLTNANPAGQTATDYTYDGACRLTSAYLPGGAFASYSYAADPASDGCQAPDAGADTNRTGVTITPPTGSATTTDYCYNSADQLTGTLTGGTANPGSYSYDSHGNQTADGRTQLTWDSSDRVASTTAGGSTTTYTYDACNRVIDRQTGGTTTGYWYSGYSDSPAGTLDASGNITAAFYSLPGGVSVTVQPSASTWSYPDLHGHFIVATNGSGVMQGSIAHYDPWGQLLTGSQPLANAPGTSDLGAFGTSGKVTDTTTGLIIMGARAYSPAEARFLSVDPVRGGCANLYVYVFGDPLSESDLTGQASCQDASDTISGSCSTSLLGLSFSCTISIGPKKAAELEAEVVGLPGTVAAAIISGAVCGAIGFLAGPVTAFIAGIVCSALAAAGVWQLNSWLSQGAQDGQYADLTIGAGILSKPVVKFYHTTAPLSPCS